MRTIQRQSVVELTAAHLRKGLNVGRWSGKLPGVARLAAELDVAPATLRGALRRLEAEGLLGARGPGRCRSITAHGLARRQLRVGFLLYDAPYRRNPESAHVFDEIQLALERAGHDVFYYPKSQVELQHQVGRIASHLLETPADAWMVVAGSRGLLEWCAAQVLPTMALYGRSEGLEVARTGPDKLPAYLAATRQLIGLGHRRIVLIAQSPRRMPTPGNSEAAFLAELAAHGIPTGDYNLPDWVETPEGFHDLLERLFRSTPPTALIIDETNRFIAAMHFLLRSHIQVPTQVSLVSTDDDSLLAWCHPAVAHMHWDNACIVRRVVRWMAAVRRGNQDRKTINYPAEFVPGHSIGPVYKGCIG